LGLISGIVVIIKSGAQLPTITISGNNPGQVVRTPRPVGATAQFGRNQTDHSVHTVSEKNIPNNISCHLKKRYTFLIIFGTNISGTSGNQVIIQYSTSPNALPGENKTNEI